MRWALPAAVMIAFLISTSELLVATYNRSESHTLPTGLSTACRAGALKTMVFSLANVKRWSSGFSMAKERKRGIVRLRLPTSLLLAWEISAFAAAPSDRVSSVKATVNFSRDILPVLSDNCFQCHGPDEKARKAKLRLDTQEGAFRVKNGNAVIVSGKSAESDLFRRITAVDPDDLMPPPDSNHKLTPQQIELVKRWIDQGAKLGRHWAFDPIGAPMPPCVKNKHWPMI